MERTELAAAIFRVAHLTGTVRRRSGAEATEYFDKYRFESDPKLLARITLALIPLVPPETEVVTGLELGGIPLATMLSQATGLPALFVRKAAKGYGTCQLAEGGPVSNRLLLLVEDVVTSGGQLIESAKALRTMGAVVRDVVCVIDREAGGAAALGSQEITLRSLFRMNELKVAASPTV